MKKVNSKSLIHLISVLLVVVSSGIFFLNKSVFSEISETEGAGMEEDLRGRIEWMNKTLADPATGTIPNLIRQKELVFTSAFNIQSGLNKTFGQWVQQGPFNVGGRTRAIAIDITNEKNIIAGAAMGGIWRSNNNGLNWTKCFMDPEVFNISCITQDNRLGKTNIWYAGTGELYGANLPGAYYAGNGMYKSVNGGVTWAKLVLFQFPWAV